MKLARSVIDDLVQRRLWPVALLLLAGIVAVPILLGHKGGSTPPAAAPVTAATAGTTDVALATTGMNTADTPASGRTLGRLHPRDPFVPPAKAVTPHTAARAAGGTSSPSDGGTGGGSTTATGGSAPLPSSGGGTSSGASSSGGAAPASTSTTTTTTTTTTTSPEPVPTYAYTAVDVAFGRVSSGLTVRRDVSRGSPLPGPVAPVVVFLGLQAHTHTAVFVVSGDADPRGDGHCRPRPADCQTLLMRAGETEFLSAGRALYRLDVRAVRPARTTSKAKARAAARRVPAARAARAARWVRASGAAHWVRADQAHVAPDRPAPANLH